MNEQIKGDNKLEIKIYEGIPETILEQWQDLWNESPLKNFFNAPLWYRTSLDTFHYKKNFLVACYNKKQLVGILPLVYTKKYGVPVYMAPGNQYYDNSSLLLAKHDTEVIRKILEKLTKIGNFYLSEISQEVTMLVSTSIPKIVMIKSSLCPFLPLLPDPYRFLSKKNKRIIISKCKKAEGNLWCKIYNENAGNHIKILLEIDAESSKKSESKETFADPLLKQLLENMQKLQNKALVMGILFYKNEPICYNFGFVYGKTYIASGTAYKSSWSHFSPGRVLVYLFLPELLKMGIDTADFSRGYTQYKKDFTPYSYQQYTIFSSPHTLILTYWKTLDVVEHFLEQHPSLFTFFRKMKHMIIK